MKKIISVLFVVLMLSACGDRLGQRRVNIAIVGKASNSYWSDMELGARASAKRLNVSIKFYKPYEEDPASWQIRTIGELIANPLDGIAFVAADPKSLAPIMLKAIQSEIPCVALDTDMVGKSRHVYIGTGDYRAGKQAGENLLALLDNKGSIAIVASFSTNTRFLKRVRGFRDALADNAHMDIAAKIEKENSAVQMSDVESLLGSHPDLDGIFCVSDSDAIAVAEAIQKTGKTGLVKIISMGESPALMEYVRDDVIQVAIARRPYRIGFLSVLVLHNMAKVGIQRAMKILPESGMIDTGTTLVTPVNIDQYREELTNLGIEVTF